MKRAIKLQRNIDYSCIKQQQTTNRLITIATIATITTQIKLDTLKFDYLIWQPQINNNAISFIPDFLLYYILFLIRIFAFTFISFLFSLLSFISISSSSFFYLFNQFPLWLQQIITHFISTDNKVTTTKLIADLDNNKVITFPLNLIKQIILLLNLIILTFELS